MFRNWRSIFNGSGGPIGARIPIYSFDGRDVLADPFWSVVLTLWLYFYMFFFPPISPFLCLLQAPEEHLARVHRHRHASDGQALRDVANGPRVRGGPVVEPGRRSAPRPADAELLQPVHCSLHRDPQEPLNLFSTSPLQKLPPPRSTRGERTSFSEPEVVFSTSSVSRAAFSGAHLILSFLFLSSDITVVSESRQTVLRKTETLTRKVG